jgi:hypothetical protein
MFRLTFLCICLVFASLLLAGIGNARLSQEGVLAIWLLDEGKGDKVTDASGNSHDGKFVGSPAWVSGKFGTALSFDGQDDFVQMNDPVVGQIVDFTMGCWVKPSGTQKAYAELLDCHSNSHGIGIEQVASNANLFIAFFGSGVWEGVADASAVQLKADEWNHFAYKREKTTKTIYLNGKAAKEETVSGNPVLAATDNFRIGNWTGGTREFKGIIDEAFVFSRSLSQDEIVSVMQSGITGAFSVSPEDKVASAWGMIKTQY